MKRWSRRAGAIACVAGVFALGAAVSATTEARATETLTLKTVINPPAGQKFTSFDISFVDTALGIYILGDRTNSAVDVINTSTNTLVLQAGQGSFTGPAGGNNNLAGPDGVMTVRNREIWAGDGNSTLKFLSTATGALLGQVFTGGTTRVDEMCFDPVHNIGFVANNAENPPFITAVSARTHTIIGKIIFDGTPQNGGGIGVNATDGIEQCQFNPRDNNIYVAVPEVNGAGDNSSPGAVARINPVTMQILAAPLIPLAACSGPQGLAIGPVVGSFGEMLTGCNGAVANAAANRPTALVDDGTAGGTFGASVSLSWQAGNDMVAFNGIVTGALTAPGFTNGDGHYYLARSGNNSPVNPNVMTDGFRPHCPAVLSSTLPGGNYGGDIYKTANVQGEAYSAAGSQTFAGPQVVGMINSVTLENDPDTITGQFNCTATTFGAGGVANLRGSNHSVAADPIHNQIYVPIASTAWGAPATGPCAAGGGVDANGCIAVYATTGSDP
jgi:hypothetical protein